MSSPEAKVQRVALLAIGDEVLRGEISNTNAAFLSERLFEAGFEISEHAVFSDDPQAIRRALVRLRAEADIIVATGGLGPTEDDRTVVVLNGTKVTDYTEGDPVPPRKFWFEGTRGTRPNFGWFGLQNHGNYDEQKGKYENEDADVVIFKEVAMKPLAK